MSLLRPALARIGRTLAGATAAFATAHAQPQPPGKIPASLEIQFSWAGVQACSPLSPAFRIEHVPPETSALRFTMRDLQAPDYPHGGGIVRWAGSPSVPAGAFHYNGPCPPPGARHMYVWTVQAIGATGRVLTQGAAERPFPPG